METRVCKQCGKLKPIDAYRQYYGGRKGHYKTCLACERINNREKYLAKKASRTQLEDMEIDKIHTLWDLQRSAGLQPPRTTQMTASLVDSLDELMGEYVTSERTVPAGTVVAPHELMQWLTTELTAEPDYYLDTIYDQLKDKYRPILRIDNGTTPVYDDTYKEALDKVLDRFYKYEDKYYSE